ncbi:MAG: twin-arginine translocation signal domain-containing protein, partial [Dehalococcoidales bacterium]
MDKNKETLNEEQRKQISRRDFLVGAGTVVVGGAIGSGLLSSCESEPVTTTIEKTKTVEKTVTVGGEGAVTVTKTVGGIEPAFEAEDTYVKMIDPMGYGGDMSAVEVKNGKIVRIRPLHYDEACSQGEVD